MAVSPLSSWGVCGSTTGITGSGATSLCSAGLGDSRAAGLLSSVGSITGVTENRDILRSLSGCLFSTFGESRGPLLVVALFEIGVEVTIELVALAGVCCVLTTC